MLKKCIECEESYNPHSLEKRRAGGRINTCPACSEESTAKVLGFTAGDGKMSSITILKFSSQKEADQYKEYWQRASGLNKGKSCQLHQPGLTTTNVTFKTVSQSLPTNHKGKS